MLVDSVEGIEKEAEQQESATKRSARLRHRAAWMYYAEEMTQNAIAHSLGIGRVTVVRLLAEARALNEVKISLHALDELLKNIPQDSGAESATIEGILKSGFYSASTESARGPVT